MSFRLLITGFEPFDRAEINPTALAIKRLQAMEDPIPGAEVRAVVLPTDYYKCEQEWTRHMVEFHPQGALALGVAITRDDICPERVAINIDDSPSPDNGGAIHRGVSIREEAPAAYFSTLPFDTMVECLLRAGFPAKISNHAGAYVCNHLFYYGLHWLNEQGKDIPFGFVHVPPLPEQVREKKWRQGLGLDLLVEAVQICGQVLVDSRNDKS